MKNANNWSQNVCGCYVNLIDLINTNTWIEFDVLMQYDDFLPLSNMKLYPQYALRGLKMEIGNRITGNIVWCQVGPYIIARKAMKQGAMTLPPVEQEFIQLEEQCLFSNMNMVQYIQHNSIK